MADKQFDLLTKIKMDVADFNKGVQESKKLGNSLKSAVEQVSKDIKGSYANIAGGVSLVKDGFEGVSKIVEGLDSVIQSNMTLSDQWEKQTIAAGNAWDSVKNSISNLDFTNLYENIQRAYDAGLKYAEVLDLLEDKERGHNVAVAEAGLRLAQLKVIYQDVTKSENERKQALDEAKKIETALAKQDTENKKTQYEATKNLILQTKQLSENELMNFVKFKDGYEEKTSLAEEYNRKIKELAVIQSKGTQHQVGPAGGGSVWDVKTSNDSQREVELKKEIAGYDNEIIRLAKVMISVGDEKVKGLADEYIAFQNAKAAEVENIATLDKRYNMMDLRQQKAIGNIGKLGDAETKFARQTEKDLEKIDPLWAGMFAPEGYKTNAPSMWDNSGDPKAKMDANIQGMKDSGDWEKQTEDIIAYNEAVKDLSSSNNQLSDSFALVSSKNGELAAGMLAISGSMMKAAMNGATSLKELANAATETARQIIASYIAKGVAGAVSEALQFLPPPASLVMAGVAGAAAVTLFNSLIPKFETGGIVPGTSFYGDNIPAMVNSGEMILNLGQQARLFNMLNTGGSSNIFSGEVRFEIEGQKLVGVLSNYNRKMNRLSNN